MLLKAVQQWIMKESTVLSGVQNVLEMRSSATIKFK